MIERVQVRIIEAQIRFNSRSMEIVSKLLVCSQVVKLPLILYFDLEPYFALNECQPFFVPCKIILKIFCRCDVKLPKFHTKANVSYMQMFNTSVLHLTLFKTFYILLFLLTRGLSLFMNVSGLTPVQGCPANGRLKWASLKQKWLLKSLLLTNARSSKDNFELFYAI